MTNEWQTRECNGRTSLAARQNDGLSLNVYLFVDMPVFHAHLISL